MSEGYILGEDAAARIVRAVKQVERDGVTPQDGDGGPGIATPIFLPVACTGSVTTTLSDGTCNYKVYPGSVLVWNGANICWAAGASVWLAGLNADTLVLDTRYFAQMVSHSATPGSIAARPLFIAVS